jgi:tetratricopeptide (TPR) repeat protein
LDVLLRQIDKRTADTIRKSRDAESYGDLLTAEQMLRDAAAAIGPAVHTELAEPVRIAYGALCARLGELLKRNGDFAHAAHFFQEASDSLQNTACEEYRILCASNVVECVRLTGRNPEIRLSLITAKYEHLEHQYRAHPGCMHLAAESRAHIALSLLRAERFVEAAESLEIAIAHFREADDLPEIRLAQAGFLRRLADLQYVRMEALEAAAANYREAAALYAAYEPSTNGRQEHKTLCDLALKDIEQEMQGDI